MTAERLVSFNQAWQRGDVGALRRFLHPYVEYWPLGGELVHGREAVLRRFARHFSAAKSSEVSFERPILSGSLGVCRWRLAGRTVDGASFEIEGVDLYRFAGDLISSKDVYQKA